MARRLDVVGTLLRYAAAKAVVFAFAVLQGVFRYSFQNEIVECRIVCGAFCIGGKSLVVQKELR